MLVVLVVSVVVVDATWLTVVAADDVSTLVVAMLQLVMVQTLMLMLYNANTDAHADTPTSPPLPTLSKSNITHRHHCQLHQNQKQQ